MSRGAAQRASERSCRRAACVRRVERRATSLVVRRCARVRATRLSIDAAAPSDSGRSQGSQTSRTRVPGRSHGQTRLKAPGRRLGPAARRARAQVISQGPRRVHAALRRTQAMPSDAPTRIEKRIASIAETSPVISSVSVHAWTAHELNSRQAIWPPRREPANRASLQGAPLRSCLVTLGCPEPAASLRWIDRLA